MNNSDYIALGSAVVSLCALFATAWQGWLAFQHNRLSTKPHIVWHVSRSSVGQSGSSISFSLKNLGLGPAFVKDRYLSLDGKRFMPQGLATDEVRDLIKEAFGSKISYVLRQFGLPGVDAAIASGQEIIVATIEFPTIAFDNLHTAVDLAGDVGFHLIYESLYEQQFELHKD
jgi:hypothetical protein